MRRRRFLALALAFPLPRVAAQAPGAQRPPLAAMRLAALAERIAKLFFQVAQGVLADRSRRALAEALREFDALLRALPGQGVRDDARESYVLLRLLWDEYRAWAGRPPTRDNAGKLADRAEEIGWVASKLASVPHGEAHRAARAAALAQRVPRLHLMRRWEPRNEKLASLLAAESAQLARALDALAMAPRNTADIVAELQVAENQHAFLVTAANQIAEGGAPARAVEIIARAGDNLMEALLRAARLYAGEGA